MKNIFLIMLFLIFISETNYGQKDINFTEIEKTSYSINNQDYIVLKIQIVNKSNLEYIFWLSKKKDTNSAKNNIKDYFFTRKGDFSFAEIINDNILLDKPNSIYFDFIKNIKPNEDFCFEILVKDKKQDNYVKKTECFLKEKIIYVDENEISKYINIKTLANYYYKSNSIYFLYDSLLY